MKTCDDLPLLRWEQPRSIIVFPMVNRVGRIRDTAMKMLDKPTDRAAAHYRNQVTDSLLRGFDKLGVPRNDQDEQLGAFWDAVQSEIVRISYFDRGTGGAA